MNYNDTFYFLKEQLSTLYDYDEAINIANWVMEILTGKPKLERLMLREKELTKTQNKLLQTYVAQLMKNRPVQYVLSQSVFCGMSLYVNEAVLIPRPETEELVAWIQENECENKQFTCLDIGTGSGCIALALKDKNPNWNISACDISEDALRVAEHNSQQLDLELIFFQMDILTTSDNNSFVNMWDIIVSNPPYIPLSDAIDMSSHVLEYEPHNALFVSDQEPLQFYKAIEFYSQKNLTSGGSVYLELHQDYAVETKLFFEARGWNCQLRKDMYGNDRMLHCKRIDT